MKIIGPFKFGVKASQLEIEKALEAKDAELANKLIWHAISESITGSMSLGNVALFFQIRKQQQEQVSAMLIESFFQGWHKKNKPNLSSALNEVNTTVKQIIAR